MPSESRRRKVFATFALVLPLLLNSIPAIGADDTARTLLDRLQSKRYYDVALDFLDAIENDPRAADDLKSEVQLHRARTIYRSTELVSPGAALERRLEESAAAYAKFIEVQPNHAMALEARLELSRIQRNRGIGKLNAAKAAADPKKEELSKHGLQLLKSATDQFVSIRDDLRKKLEPLEAKGEKLTAEELAQRDAMRPQYMIVRSDVAEAFEEQADALPVESAERKPTLQKALSEFHEIATKYGRRNVGQFARVSEGRCQRKLGDLPAAIKILSGVIEDAKDNSGIAKEPNLRELGLSALLEAMECWLDDSQKAYPAAIAASLPWINDMQPAEEKDPDWAELRYLAALANKKLADTAKAKDPKDESGKKAIIEARKLATQVIKSDTQHQIAARKLLAEMGVEVAAVTPSALANIKTFEQARDAAQEAFSAAIEMPERIKIINERLKIEMDEGEIASLKKQLEEAEGGQKAGFQGALDGYRRALQLATPSTSIEDINDVRWQLGRCYYLTSRFEEASIVGEFVARRFPTDRQAKNCANLALNAIKKLYLDAMKEKRDVTLETARMMALAELLTKNWPTDDEAAQALRLLIQLRISAKDYEGVVASLSQIPESSPFRAEAESKAGQAFWAQYVSRQNELRNAANGGTPVPDPAVEQLKTKAIELLQSSLKRFGAAPPSAPSIAATTSLADIYVKSGNPQQAATMLDDPTTGPMVLLSKEDNKGLFDAQLTEFTCRVALSAQIALMPSAADSAATIAKATAAIDKLTEVLKNAPDGNEQKIVATYYTLARDMKQQLDLTTDPKVKSNLASGAEKFLQGVRTNTKDPKLLRWVAETLMGFGESFDSTTGAATADAKRYFSAAAEVFEEVLKHPLEPAVKVQVQVQQASILRELGDFKRAFENLLAILKDPANRNTPRFQMEAARTLCEWGPSGGAKYFQSAVSGTEMDPVKKENIVWGLAKISNLTRPNPQYVNVFFDARYTIVECYYGEAKKAQGEESKKGIAKAKRDLASVYRLYPLMGGPEWYAKFDALMKRLQRESGEPEAGLAALKATTTTAPKPKKP